MKKKFLVRFLGVGILQFFLTASIAIANEPSRITLLKEMFDKVTIEKNDKAIPLYYDNSFKLYSNGKKIKYDAFLQMHRDIYKTSIQYKIRYDKETFVAQGNKVAGRLFITTIKPNEPSREIEVILVAEYKNNKLYRVWELTYPDWSKMKAFQKKN